ncbi:MAG: DNA recombination protein RmuC [Desulfovibrio sp.]|jgi:DNA recombination protein RmuC|nr:DNA recombination protein RmuC [Desulfovibrio sp.]
MDYIIAVQIVLFVLIVVNIFLTLKLRIGNNVAKSDDIARIDTLIRDEFCRNREELNNSFKNFSEMLTGNVDKLSHAQQIQFKNFSEQLSGLVKNFNDRTITIQNQLEKSNKENRMAQTDSLKSFEEKFTISVKEFNDVQKQKFDELVNKQENIKKDTEAKLKEIRDTVENKLKTLQDENVKKLEEMRKTVDEKLQETVEKRFTESFKLISTRLEAVHKGLGEMQTLASGVGDLQKVLSNVKTRGNLGEMQLGAILYQILSPKQYKQNVQVKKGSQERVEYAIELPGRSNDNKPLLLPIDSKFPIEDYQRLLDVYDKIANKNSKEVEDISKQFEISIRKSAKLICEKYINPPDTTDFAIMFVPSEGLYAEVVRRTELFETLRRDFKITVVGPTNLVAFLSSLQMGFKTLAIEKRSSEVWEILGTVKTEFSSFGAVLGRTKKKLQEAANVIDQAEVRARVIEKKLTTVEQLPQGQPADLMGEALTEDSDGVEQVIS